MPCALFNALRGITGRTTFAWLSPTAALEQLGDVIFRLPPRYQLSPAIAGLTSTQAAQRRAVDGPNTVPAPRRPAAKARTS